MQLSPDAIATLQEVRGPVNYEAMKQSLQPALDLLKSEHTQILAEEDSLRAQLDYKLSMVSASSEKINRYQGTMDELVTLSQGIQG